MSKHFIEINFEQLKFNLYELLAVPTDAPEKKIKKSYRKLIIKFHPDKNNLIDEEIYNHLTLANQILTDPKLREKYDEWLKSSLEESAGHETLKHNFKNSNKVNYIPTMPDEARQSYYDKHNKLNEKHGISRFNEESTIDKYSKKKMEMDEGIFIDNNIKNKKEFDNYFENIKSDNNNQQIIRSTAKEEIMEYNGEILGDKYLSVLNYDLLYSNDNVQSTNYSSLDRAFKLQPKIDFKEVNITEKMKEYKNMSDDLSNLYLESKDKNSSDSFNI